MDVDAHTEPYLNVAQTHTHTHTHTDTLHPTRCGHARVFLARFLASADRVCVPAGFPSPPSFRSFSHVLVAACTHPPAFDSAVTLFSVYVWFGYSTKPDPTPLSFPILTLSKAQDAKPDRSFFSDSPLRKYSQTMRLLSTAHLKELHRKRIRGLSLIHI